MPSLEKLLGFSNTALGQDSLQSEEASNRWEGCSPVSFIPQGTNMQDYHQLSMSHRIPLFSFMSASPWTAFEMPKFYQALGTMNAT